MKASSRPQISVNDVMTWGAVVSEKTNGLKQPREYYIVEVPEGTNVVQLDGTTRVGTGTIVAVDTTKRNVAFYQIGNSAEMDKKKVFCAIDGNVPTLEEVRNWSECEKKLSEEEKKLLDDYVLRQGSYFVKVNGSIQGLKNYRNTLYKSLIQGGNVRDVVREERAYQAKSESGRRSYDQQQIRNMRAEKHSAVMDSFGQKRAIKKMVRGMKNGQNPLLMANNDRRVLFRAN